jgi:hypothetical protein
VGPDKWNPLNGLVDANGLDVQQVGDGLAPLRQLWELMTSGTRVNGGGARVIMAGWKHRLTKRG